MKSKEYKMSQNKLTKEQEEKVIKLCLEKDPQYLEKVKYLESVSQGKVEPEHPKLYKWLSHELGELFMYSANELGFLLDKPF